ncbi:MAG TPA: hypothetical protein VJS92_07860 [Candidatus Polarisedimenticolaceae bacterium]|nr:hypothetical protein [Candidatus Polarisedimenticolaceae bacterium]
MRTLKVLAAASTGFLVLLAALVIFVPAPALADPPGSDPGCAHPCAPHKRLNGFQCDFVGCDGNGACLYAC